MADSKKLKVGDYVRVLRNDVGAPTPVASGGQFKPFDILKIPKLGRKDPYGEVIVYGSGYIPVKDVEKIMSCVCAGPVLKVLGCKCGHRAMTDALEKERERRGLAAQNVFRTTNVQYVDQDGHPINF